MDTFIENSFKRIHHSLLKCILYVYSERFDIFLTLSGVDNFRKLPATINILIALFGIFEQPIDQWIGTNPKVMRKCDQQLHFVSNHGFSHNINMVEMLIYSWYIVDFNKGSHFMNSSFSENSIITSIFATSCISW